MPGMSVPSPGDATMQTMWPPEAALLPLLPKDQAHRPTVAFDLDGTLIGSSDDPAAAQPYGGACSVITTYVDPAGGLGKRCRYIWLRPHARTLLHALQPYCELVMWTAANRAWADAALAVLDPTQQIFDHRLYDEHTLSDALPCGAIKHVAMLGRDLCKVLLIEDNLQAVLGCPQASVWVSSWRPEQSHDVVLRAVKDLLLQQVLPAADVRIPLGALHTQPGGVAGGILAPRPIHTTISRRRMRALNGNAPASAAGAATTVTMFHMRGSEAITTCKTVATVANALAPPSAAAQPLSQYSMQAHAHAHATAQTNNTCSDGVSHGNVTVHRVSSSAGANGLGPGAGIVTGTKGAAQGNGFADKWRASPFQAILSMLGRPGDNASRLASSSGVSESGSEAGSRAHGMQGDRSSSSSSGRGGIHGSGRRTCTSRRVCPVGDDGGALLEMCTMVAKGSHPNTDSGKDSDHGAAGTAQASSMAETPAATHVPVVHAHQGKAGSSTAERHVSAPGSAALHTPLHAAVSRSTTSDTGMTRCVGRPQSACKAAEGQAKYGGHGGIPLPREKKSHPLMLLAAARRAVGIGDAFAAVLQEGRAMLSVGKQV